MGSDALDYRGRYEWFKDYYVLFIFAYVVREGRQKYRNDPDFIAYSTTLDQDLRKTCPGFIPITLNDIKTGGVHDKVLCLLDELEARITNQGVNTGKWITQYVRRYDAGMKFSDRDPEILLDPVRKIKALLKGEGGEAL